MSAIAPSAIAMNAARVVAVAAPGTAAPRAIRPVAGRPRIAIVDHGMLKACDTRANLLRTLDARAVLTVHEVPGGLAERLRMLPGVRNVEITGKTVTISAAELPPILA